jgi:hypothetical protein
LPMYPPLFFLFSLGAAILVVPCAVRRAARRRVLLHGSWPPSAVKLRHWIYLVLILHRGARRRCSGLVRIRWGAQIPGAPQPDSRTVASLKLGGGGRGAP